MRGSAKHLNYFMTNFTARKLSSFCNWMPIFFNLFGPFEVQVDDDRVSLVQFYYIWLFFNGSCANFYGKISLNIWLILSYFLKCHFLRKPVTVATFCQLLATHFCDKSQVRHTEEALNMGELIWCIFNSFNSQFCKSGANVMNIF